MDEVSLAKSTTDEPYWTLLMIKSALVQVKASAKQQAITWAKVDPDLCRHMTSLGRNVKDILSDTK